MHKGALTNGLLQEGANLGNTAGTKSDDTELRSRAWRWRELVTRIASGCESSADVSAAWWAGAEDLEGPNFPCPIGFQADLHMSPAFFKKKPPCFCFDRRSVLQYTHSEEGDER